MAPNVQSLSAHWVQAGAAGGEQDCKVRLQEDQRAMGQEDRH